jgi:NAD(P)-dependent dehydrogenase (short-subunit alcohol dehydrogenase family)
MADLNGKTAVIAGAAGGLGRVASAAFAAAGANLVLLGREQAKLESLAAELGLDASRVLVRGTQAADEADVTQAAAAALQKFGRVDILLNVVGGWVGGTVLDTERELFDSMLEQHFYSILALVKAFVPSMLANGWGRVLGLSSPHAGRPTGKNAAYAAGKSAMEALLLSLAREVKGRGVTVNILLVSTIDVKHERQINPSEENKGWTSPEEISATLMHLCSQEAGQINGARIPIFGEPL